MKRSITIVSLLVSVPVFLVLISGCMSTGPLTTREANYPADQVNARGVFAENCATCHGKNGRAHTFHGWLVGAQDLTDPMWWEETTDSEITHAIKTGPRLMPAFAKKLSPSEIQALTRYVDSLHTAS